MYRGGDMDGGTLILSYYLTPPLPLMERYIKEKLFMRVGIWVGGDIKFFIISPSTPSS